MEPANPYRGSQRLGGMETAHLSTKSKAMMRIPMRGGVTPLYALKDDSQSHPIIGGTNAYFRL